MGVTPPQLGKKGKIFFLKPSLSGDRRMFYGPSGWSIEWQKDQSFWQLSNDRIPGNVFKD